MSVISVVDIENASGVLNIGQKDILTPLAADRAKELGVKIVRDGQKQPAGAAQASAGASSRAAAGQRVPRARGPAPPPPDKVNSGAMSAALYRRGAPLPQALRLDALVGARASNDAPAAAVRTPTGPRDRRPSVAVIGAGHVGSMSALRLTESSLFSRTVLIDIVPGLASGLALDMWHSSALRGFSTRIEGSTELSAVQGADYVVMTAGRPRQPGMSRTDLTSVNAEIISNVADAIRTYAPRAVVVVVTNPLEEMTHIMAARTGFPPERVIGMAGVLDSARFCSLVALTGIAQPRDIKAIALGSHGAEMVIPLSQATANGRPLELQLPADELTAIVERTRDSGAEVVKLLQKGSAYFSPAESAAAMVCAMVTGGDSTIAACVQSRGAYAVADTRVGLPVRLGPGGVSEIVNLALTRGERADLAKAAASIAARISALG